MNSFSLARLSAWRRPCNRLRQPSGAAPARASARSWDADSIRLRASVYHSKRWKYSEKLQRTTSGAFAKFELAMLWFGFVLATSTPPIIRCVSVRVNPLSFQRVAPPPFVKGVTCNLNPTVSRRGPLCGDRAAFADRGADALRRSQWPLRSCAQ